MINILLNLFSVFLKIGSLAFGGGYAVLPLIQKYIVEDMKWLSVREMTDLISLSQITPGPIAINAATFVGTKMYGVIGAVIATVAEIIPGMILMLILGHFLFNGKKLSFMEKVLKGLKPAVSGLILIATIDMFHSSILLENKVEIIGAIGFVVGGGLYLSKKADIIKVIVISAMIGIVIGFIS